MNVFRTKIVVECINCRYVRECDNLGELPLKCSFYNRGVLPEDYCSRGLPTAENDPLAKRGQAE